MIDDIHEIKVGERYLSIYGEEFEVLFIGNTSVFYRKLDSCLEMSASHDYFRKYFKLVQKEPKKIGRLYMFIYDGTSPHYVKGQIHVNPNMSGCDEYWQAVTVNEVGEVFEVVE